MRGPFGSAAPAIAEALEQAGYASAAKRDGEVERARARGAELATALE